MFRSSFFKIIFIFHAVGISFADIPIFSRRDVIDLVESHPKVMELYLNAGHEIYPYGMLNSKPEPSSSSGGGLRPSGKKAMDLFIRNYNKGKYHKAYLAVYHVLQNVCYKYLYRFLYFAIEMNNKEASMIDSIPYFNRLTSVVRQIILEDRSPNDNFFKLLEIFNFHYLRHSEDLFAVSDEIYRKDLGLVMERLEIFIDFAQIDGLYDQQFAVEHLTVDDLKTLQHKELEEAIKLLKKVETFPEIDKLDGRKCIICWRELSTNDPVNGFWPCGHTDLCDDCIILCEECPYCRRSQQYILRFYIVKRARILQYGVWDRIPCDVIDQKAMCINCEEEKPCGSKIVAYPCGHGLYCRKCIDLQNCSVCGKTIIYFMIVYLNK